MFRLSRWGCYGLLLCLCVLTVGCGPGTFTDKSGTSIAADVNLVAIPGSDLGVLTSASIQLTATNLGTTEAMSWRMEGNAGNVGSVTDGGLYTAPVVAPIANVAAISGSSLSHIGATVTVHVTITNPVPVILSVAPSSLSSNASIAGTLTGRSFVPGSIVIVDGGAVTTSFLSGTSLRFSRNAAPVGSESVSVQVASPTPGGGLSQSIAVPVISNAIPVEAATRFLKQASWGPTADTVALVQQIGFAAYVDQQLALPVDPVSNAQGDTNQVYAALWTNGLSKPSQLRQRTMWMWFKLFNPPGTTLSAWLSAIPELLQRDAFATFQTLLLDASLNTEIGINLSSCCANDAGPNPNQNYARELLQLFSIGPSALNQDGTVILQSDGTPTPAYSQTDVVEASRALTGWNASPTVDTDAEGVTHLVTKPWQSSHDWNSKTILGTTIPGGGDTMADLSAVIPLLAGQPNTAPFMSQRIIREFITSNPSPAYVARVTKVWRDDGSGVRGNLAAVIKAVLLDPEARSGDDPLVTSSATAGRVMDVVQFQMEVNRLLGSSWQATWWSQVNACEMNECSFNAPSVFGYYPASYTLPGSSIVAPELSLYTASALQTKSVYLSEIIYPTTLTNITVDWSSWSALATGDGSSLVDAINQRCLAGMMSPGLRAILLQAFQEVVPDKSDSQAKRLMYLTLMSPEFAVIR